ncbi:MAG: dienelactone hydrolase family protein [Thermoplasmatota archaeon]
MTAKTTPQEQAWPIELRRGTTNVGVVMVHDITGLDATNLSFADRLCRAGFWVAAVDLFRGKRATSIQEGMALRQALSRDDLRDALRSAHESLRAAAPAGTQIGSIGFCMGGAAALEGACTSPFSFCVDWYGMIEDADAVHGLAGPLLLILASEDDRVNPWAYAQLLPKLDEHRKRFEVICYPATVHPFHRPDWVTRPFPGGGRSYDEVAAEDAWMRTLRFIADATGPNT